MSLRTQMQSALEGMFSTDMVGRVATYNGSTVNIIVEHQEYDNTPNTGRSDLSRMALARVLKADVSSPEYRDSIVLDSQTWRVVRVVSDDWLCTQVEIEREQRPGI